MKKITLLVIGIFLTIFTPMRADDKAISVKELPATAQQFIRKHFSKQQVAIVTMDKDFLDKSYDVHFANGVSIEFDKAGKWTEVDCKTSKVPDAIIPMRILKYVRATYPNNKIVKIENDGKEYEVKLQTDVELTFDKAFKLIDVD